MRKRIAEPSFENMFPRPTVAPPTKADVTRALASVSRVDPEVAKLLAAALQAEAAERISADFYLRHEWKKQYDRAEHAEQRAASRVDELARRVKAFALEVLPAASKQSSDLLELVRAYETKNGAEHAEP